MAPRATASSTSSMVTSARRVARGVARGVARRPSHVGEYVEERRGGWSQVGLGMEDGRQAKSRTGFSGSKPIYRDGSQDVQQKQESWGKC
jgi:hypothetical protein